ncbi:hypothetical protein D0Z70_19965 [Sphingobium terrigena]|uniref:Peptidase S1 domain-containing protein n=1 Tax=Sphingobium terrigena TaxID=2304063 RepID=A0A418YN75_9SPHN|nr:trypsin-like serine protease [Sphingobium terrigena]RJG52486.1 hypothetical protein D0Z70_19965 [Sphingobium terrigena]
MRRALAILLLCISSIKAYAQPLEFTQPADATEASPEIIGGSKAIMANWPATFVFTATSGEHCTATAIGPQVLLTAEHCIRGAANGTIKASGIAVQCEAHPFHNSNYDIALCFTAARIVLAAGQDFETIDLKLKPADDTRLSLLGFGCISRGGVSGVLYEGTSVVKDATAQKAVFFTTGGVSVCAGDSGGAAYQPGVGSSRRVVGVASAAISGQNDLSRFTALANGPTIVFFEDWAGRQRDPKTGAVIPVEICLVDKDHADAPADCHI